MINILDAVKNWKNLYHQEQAFNYLDQATTLQIKQKFATLYRNKISSNADIKILDAVKHFKNFNHQVEAFKYLNESTPDSVKKQFAEIYRKATFRTFVSKGELAHVWNVNERVISDSVIIDLNKCLNTFEINTPSRISHFLDISNSLAEQTIKGFPTLSKTLELWKVLITLLSTILLLLLDISGWQTS